MTNLNDFHTVQDLKFDPKKLQQALADVLKIKNYDDAGGISNFGAICLNQIPGNPNSTKGNNARGSKEVTATGNASVAHQIAIKISTAKTNHAAWLLISFVPLLVSNNSPSKELKLGGIRSLIPQITIIVKAIKPIKKPFFLYAGITYTNIFS